MMDCFRVHLTVWQVFQGPKQSFIEYTLAANSEEALLNVRERYTGAYQLNIHAIHSK